MVNSLSLNSYPLFLMYIISCFVLSKTNYKVLCTRCRDWSKGLKDTDICSVGQVAVTQVNVLECSSLSEGINR